MIPSSDPSRPIQNPGELAHRRIEAPGEAARRVARSAPRDRGDQGSGRWKGHAFESYLEGDSNEEKPAEGAAPDGGAGSKAPADPEDPRGTFLDTTA